MGKLLKNYDDLITSYYGNREYWLNGILVKDFHIGIDIGGNLDYIKAFEKGIVVEIVSNIAGYVDGGSYGNYVVIDHGNGFKTRYAHLKQGSITVNVNQQVLKDEVIGYIGATGTVTAAHIHFEVIQNGNTVDPMPYYNGEKKIIKSNVIKTVIRDENKNQVRVNVRDLRVRENYDTNSNIIGIAEVNGIYNYYEVKQTNDYDWYRIAENQWIANKENWCTVYLKGEISMEKLNEEIKKLNEIIIEKDKEIKLLKGTKIFDVFVAQKSGYYFIKLDKGNVLKYKKV